MFNLKTFVSTLFLVLISSQSFAYEVYETDFDVFKDSYNIDVTPAHDETILKWGDGPLGTGAQITYGFNVVDLEPYLPPDYQNVITSAFETWSSYANLDFAFSDNNADIVFGSDNVDGPYSVLGYAVVQNNRYAQKEFGEWIGYSYLSSGGIFFDLGDSWTTSDFTPAGSFDLYTVALHEIGHALGLAHEDGKDSFGNNISIMNTYYSIADHLYEDDIAAIQYLYGARVSAVPEPTQLALAILGGLILLTAARKSKETAIQ